MIRSLQLAAAALVLGFAGSALAQLTDQVFPTSSGLPEKGTVTKMTKSSVTLDLGGTPREYDVNKVRKVTFAADTPEVKRGRDAVMAGRYEDGKDTLAAIDLDTISQNAVKQDVLFYKAYATAKLALLGSGDREAAHSELFDFVKQYQENFHFYEAAELLGDLAVARGKYEDAVSYYNGLSSAPWPEYQLRASILKARALIPQGQFAQAQKMYEDVTASPLNTPEANREKLFARVGRALCLAETGDVQTAQSEVADVIANNEPRDKELFGRVYNVQGACHRKSGEPKLAVLSYLHTHLLFYGEAETHAEALYYLGKLWSQIKEDDRASQATALLKQRYSGTIWAQRDS